VNSHTDTDTDTHTHTHTHIYIYIYIHAYINTQVYVCKYAVRGFNFILFISYTDNIFNNRLNA